MSNPIKVDGIDYSKPGVEQLRRELIMIRNQSFEMWPQTIEITVALSHVIAILAFYLEDGILE